MAQRLLAVFFVALALPFVDLLFPFFMVLVAFCGKRRKEHDTAHGTQPGDPAKAARAIIAAVESDEPPAFLLLGNDALKTYRRIATARLDTIEAWGSTSPQAPT